MCLRLPLRQRLIVCGIAIVGGVLGGGFCGGCVPYGISDGLKVGGFPIPAYAWERSDSLGWVDFVSPLTLPIMAVDFLLGFLVCGGIVYWLGVKCARRMALPTCPSASHKSGEEAQLGDGKDSQK